MNNHICYICLLKFDNSISTSKCGHCFHTTCLEKMYQTIEKYNLIKCPTCRQVNKFFELYI